MFGVVVAALVAGAGAQVASPLVVRAFLDLARTGAAVDRLVAVAALFVGVAVAGSALEVLRSHAGAVLAWHAMNALRHRLFRHTIDLGHSFFARTAPGSLLERIDGDVARLGSLLSDLLPELAANLLMTAGIAVVLLFEDWRVGAAVAAFAVVGAVAVDRVRALGVPRFVRSRAAGAAFFGRLSEWLAAAEELRPPHHARPGG
ncbi:MAG: ABC transporter transmembrane domain-containing protein [Spirochaetaceae bacterium]|nr:ABC transporter transmembrane domain-containing protein [Spirochaetaceae bacterium]MDE0227367.1 ABC transporter transmembrane domain-containing protein [Spirochaetaceae bacterium]